MFILCSLSQYSQAAIGKSEGLGLEDPNCVSQGIVRSNCHFRYAPNSIIIRARVEDVSPNPTLGTIVNRPYYAVKVVPGSFGNFAGIRTDAAARAIDANPTPIPDLYVVGRDMASIMGGHYPAGGINLGPAITFWVYRRYVLTV